MHMLRPCSLSMLHRTCKNMHTGIGLSGLSMPNGLVYLMHAHLF